MKHLLLTEEGHESSRLRELLALLADGQCHSGEALATQLGVTRAAVWKTIAKLREMGIEIQALASQGYQLPMAVSLYDANAIAAVIDPAIRPRLQRIEVLMTVDSTNQHVNDMLSHTRDECVLCVSELQTSGRGRRGRRWLSPFGSGICMSVGYRFDDIPMGFSAIALVVGVALVRALRHHGVQDAQLKWPNDVLIGGKKLAGILTEMRGEPNGPSSVVIGIGCNLRNAREISTHLAAQVDIKAQDVTCIEDVLGQTAPNRNAWVGWFMDALLCCLDDFSRGGFSVFFHEWQRYDALRHAPVEVNHAGHTIAGIALGVSEDGGLLVETPLGVQRFASAEVTVRRH